MSLPKLAVFGDVIERLMNRGDLRPDTRERMAWQLWLITERAGTRAVDVGCNTGVLTLYMAQLGYDMTGVDQSEPALEVARRGAADSPSARCRYVKSDATDLPFGRDHFDWGICTECLEHLEKPVAALRELVRVVKPGGTVYVSTPRDGLIYDPTHCQVFSRERMTEVARAAGLTPVWDDHPAHPSFLFWSAKK